MVVGFNDSGSFFESILAQVGGVSFNGVARSTDQGAHYTDLAFLNPGPDVNNFLAGDPVLGCADANTFYYASLFETGPATAPITAVSVSKSTDGGLAFADPVEAAAKDGFTHMLDKDWMAIDPRHPRRIYVTYTDFDFSGACGPPNQATRIAIELVRSTDGGTTWSSPHVIDQVCSPSNVAGLFVQGSQVTVDAHADVAWEFIAADYVTREIRLRRSDEDGDSFGPLIKVSDVACSGDCDVLQAGFRAFIDLQSIAVDRSETSTRGSSTSRGMTAGMSNTRTIPTGFYGYADALVSVSRNGGRTWGTPVRINQNAEPLPNGRGTDQYMPRVAVDNTGRVAACFYDRRQDPQEFLL